MSKTYILWSFLYIVCNSGAANIFAVVQWPSKSHSAWIEPLLRRLAKRGHQIDVVTHYPSHATSPGYNEISIAGSLPLSRNNLSVDFYQSISTYQLVHSIATKSGVQTCSKVLTIPQVQNFTKTKKRYDLIITHIFGSDCMLGFAHVFNATIVSFDGTVNFPWTNDRIGNIDNPSYIPNLFLYLKSSMNLLERIKNTADWVVYKSMYKFLQEKQSNKIIQGFFGNDIPSLSRLMQQTSLILVNSHYSMNNVRPVVANFKEIGGFHFFKPKPLSQYHESLLNTSSKGVIYFTMGSMLTTESFDPEKLQAMFDAFSELPYKVLWKADAAKLPKGLHIPKNIHFEKWMPQLDILCNSKVKLFVSHGGLLGGQEAVYCAVPRLGIPIFADQEANIHSSEKMGIAIKVAYKDINKATILRAATKLMDDPSYKKNVQRLSRIFKDRPIPSLDEAVYWVEYVTKYKGAFHLRSMAADLSWFEYYCVDVLSVCTTIIAVAMLITAYFSKYQFLKFCNAFTY